MNREKYSKQRNELMKEAENLINEGKIEESEAKMKEVEGLDNEWEKVKLANANMNALKDKEEVVDLEDKTENIKEVKIVENTIENKEVDDMKIYENAWAKHMQGIQLDNGEQEAFDKINREFNNAYTHDTGNTSVLIPDSVVAGIWKRAEEMYPLVADVRKFNVKGTLTIKKHNSIDAGDATWYGEGTATADEQNTFGELQLSGCELSKSITVSWKLRAMATEEFMPYIQSELGERIGVALGNGIAKGAGPTATPREPEGIETALLGETSTPQVVQYDPDNGTTPVPLTYEIITEAIGKIHSSYLDGAAIYANSSTIWNQLANLKDDNGRPLFIPDVTSGGVGRMFGMVVKPDAGMTVNNILIGNASKGYVMNTNEPMSVATEEHVKSRTVDYAAYTIVDGAVMDTKAFTLIQEVTV